MTSPMRAPHERSTVHISPRPPLKCRVYVSSGAAPTGWYEAELLEWVNYPSTGWTGIARYKTSASGGYVGHFLVEQVRGVNAPE